MITRRIRLSGRLARLVTDRSEPGTNATGSGVKLRLYGLKMYFFSQYENPSMTFSCMY